MEFIAGQESRALSPWLLYRVDMVSPAWTVEREYWQAGVSRVAGIDEVGMGAWAGPVVAAAVVFEADAAVELTGIVVRDSKKMTLRQRERANQWIQQHAASWAIGEASVAEVDQLNIRRASHVAMQRAADGLTTPADLLLIDGTPAQPHPHIPAVNIVDGDALVFSIAAASIVAKVYRDQVMQELEQHYPAYGWGSNKGYGATVHKEALGRLGPTPHHRRSYAPVRAAS